MSPAAALTLYAAICASMLGLGAFLLPRRAGLPSCAVMIGVGAALAGLGAVSETENWRFMNPGEDMHPYLLYGLLIGCAGLAGLPAIWLVQHHFPPLASGTAMAVSLVLLLIPAVVLSVVAIVPAR